MTTKEESEVLHIKNYWLRMLLRLSWAVLFLCMIPILFAFGPGVEARYNHPLDVFLISEINHVDRQTSTIEGILIKHEGMDHCKFRGVTAFANDFETPIKTIGVTYEPKDVVDTRPPGSQEYGPWTLTTSAEELGILTTLIVRHRCHALWEITKEMKVMDTRKLFPELVK